MQRILKFINRYDSISFKQYIQNSSQTIIAHCSCWFKYIRQVMNRRCSIGYNRMFKYQIRIFFIFLILLNIKTGYIKICTVQ